MRKKTRLKIKNTIHVFYKMIHKRNGPGEIQFLDFLIIVTSLSFLKAAACIYWDDNGSTSYIFAGGLLFLNEIIFLVCPRWTDVNIKPPISSFILDTLASFTVAGAFAVYGRSLQNIFCPPCIFLLSLCFCFQTAACYYGTIERLIQSYSEVANLTKPEENKKKD